MEHQVCPNCGAKIVVLDEPVMYIFQDTTYRGLADLFEKKFDITKCLACGGLLEVLPTVTAYFANPNRVLFTLGTQNKMSRQEFIRMCKEPYDKIGIPVSIEECLTMEEMRQAIWQLLQPRFAIIDEALEAMKNNNLPPFLAKNWRSLNAQIFTAGRLHLELQQREGATLAQDKESGQKALSPSLSLYLLADLQALVWLSLCLFWENPEVHEIPFELHLQHYLREDGGGIMPGAPERFFERADEMLSQPKQRHYWKFMIEAIRASLYVLLDKPNPHAKEWARAFFVFEAGLRMNSSKMELIDISLTISDSRAQATIDARDAWDVIMSALDRSEKEEWIKMLEAIADKIGRPGLVGRVIIEGTKIEFEEDLTVEQWTEVIKEIYDPASSLDVFFYDIWPVVRPLVEKDRADELERVADALLILAGNTDERKALIYAWFGQCLIQMRRARPLLARIGETPGEWERHLSPDVYIHLSIARMNAFLLLGRRKEAIQIMEEVLRLDNNPDKPPIISERNRAFMMNEMGRFDEALKMYMVLYDKTPKEERLDLLGLLGGINKRLGRLEEAAQYFKEGLALATGPDKLKARFFAAERAVILVFLKRYDEAIEALLNLPPSLPYNVELLDEATAWTNLKVMNISLPPESEARLSSLKADIATLAEESKQREDFTTHVEALRSLALLNRINDAESEPLWQAVLDAGAQYGQLANPVELFLMAIYSYQRKDFTKAREYVMKAPQVIAARVGNAVDTVAVLESSFYFEASLEMLTASILYVDAPWTDKRLIAELGREVINRSQIIQRTRTSAGLESLEKGLTDEVLSRLAPAEGSIAVLEWVGIESLIICFITCIDADGSVRSSWLEEPPVDLKLVAQRMRNRLAGWRPGRSGDPFDLAEWCEVENWLHSKLSSHLPDGSHLVVIEHEKLAGLPLHVAVSKKWTCSYSAGWTTLLSLWNRPRPESISPMGVILVPRFRESSEVLNALKHSAQFARNLADERAIDLLMVQERQCDSQEFRNILAKANTLSLLCHGYVSAKTHEVGLMLAYGGDLPLAHSVASGSETGQSHLMNWRDLQNLERSPAVVFSAACSTGLSHVAGVGDRLGLFSAFRRTGTRAMIAPKWDIVASAVLPILNDGMQRYVSGGESLGKALQQACIAAEAHQPKWLAWSLALEGDWR